MSTTAAVLRAAELEAQLSLERTENARRLREVEPKILEFRSALQVMNQRLQRSAEEEARLSQRLSSALDLITDLQRRLDEARACRTDGVPPELQGAVREAERLREDLRQRDEALAAAVETIKSKDRDLASLHRKLGFARSKLAEMRDAVVAARQSTAEIRAAPSTRTPAGAVERPSAPLPAVPGIRIESSVGPNSLGTRFTARESEGRRPVGVLVLSRPLDAALTARLEAMRRARHENLAAAVAFGTSPSGPYVAFERAFGETAGDWVRRIGPLPERTALPLALQIARGLREAAFHGVLHGDLSPASVRIEPTGRARVEDAGLASLHGDAVPPPASPGFASSERLRGSPPFDARSDIYSLGAILYFLLVGRAPFDGDHGAAARHPTARDVPDPRARNPAISPGVSRLVLRMTATDVLRRPQTWDEVLVELERLITGAGDARGSEPRGRVAEFVALHPWISTAVAVAPILVAAALLHVMTGKVPSARERFDAAAVKADELAANGDVAGAELVLARFLSDTGDGGVEREAAIRLDALRGR